MDYTIFDASKGEKAPMLVHDAARPFVVLRGKPPYPAGMTGRFIGRYATRKGATAAIRRDRAKLDMRQLASDERSERILCGEG